VKKTKLPGVHKPYKTKQEWAYSTLKEAIQNCALAPGTRLMLDDLGEQLDMSRVPIREALLQLQVEGLVDMMPHSGAVVAPISLASVAELFMILEELEALAGRVVAETVTPEDLKTLHDILVDGEKAIAEGDIERWSELNTKFHVEFVHLSGMPFLQQITEKTLEKWNRVRRFFLAEVLHKRIAQAQGEHEKIYAALKEGNVKVVVESVRAHNRDAMTAYLTYLSEEDQSRS
jgi:DNA-binding GntR family transcriptional regulator